ncbi:tripartite tricarboxylate transporter permease [Fusibacter sp. 3D3]|uniref:tripartite tricarboxylate transporter permease n=1 Tax=Fusibacter sp. 3D3 TaxID=1048380 RepID=UPI00085362B4|nr:tripartite tricarboxylate transporter permease [Fusibacter sp. 3D3]GAU75556.1 tricarboxylate transport membrane protein TctA [Fusibacter sp. 3D3]
MNFDLLLNGFANILQPSVLILVFLGVTGGIMVGSLPGLTATMGIALLIPFTFGMPIESSMAMLLGIFSGAIYGGSISAILIRTPGTPAAAATLLDGYPLTLRGEAGRALSMSVFSSFVGGFTGALIMTFLSPQISKLALEFGPAEYFALSIFGLSIIISVSGGSILKGLIAGVFGLLIATVGLDPISAYPRFTFGIMDLFEGPSFIPTLIGLFALAEVFKGVENIVTQPKIESKITQLLPSRADIKISAKTIIKSSIMGTFIGAIPGAGSDIAAFVGYGEAKRTSKHPEEFGKGAIEGIAAAEASNNACTGGAMIPLLSLGVPGDAVTAVLLGAFIMQGLRPGPLLYRDHLDVVYSVFASMMVANVVMFIVGTFGVKFFAKVITINRNILLPVIFLLSLVGAYSMRNSMFDVGLAIGFGVLGYFLQRFEFPVSPILLALILGPMAEGNLRRALVISKGSMDIFFMRPISAILLLAAVISIATSVIKQRKLDEKMKMSE